MGDFLYLCGENLDDRKMKRAILFLCATLMLALGFSSCSDDPTRTWTKAEVEEMAKEAAKKAVREELEKKGNNLHEQLDKVLGF